MKKALNIAMREMMNFASTGEMTRTQFNAKIKRIATNYGLEVVGTLYLNMLKGYTITEQTNIKRIAG